MNYKTNYNPDVLSCLANLSSDEVFTSPKLVNDMLDLLPSNIWTKKEVKFLDPCTKSGVFLREAAKRLIVGLENEFPELEDRLNHIYSNQLFGIGITELTSLLARRSLYCSKNAQSRYSLTNNFENENGNIFFDKTMHTWEKDVCLFCGASRSEYDRSEELETHSYQFIHKNLPVKIRDMKFDVIMGNPPYQLNVGNTSGNSSKARAIYHLFISQAIKLNPKYITMIVPSRWMTRSVEGISDDWIDNMINDRRIKILHDFIDAKDCFPGVDIKGGVSYFLWESSYNGKCNYYLHSYNSKEPSYFSNFLDELGIGIVLRDPIARNIIQKIRNVEGDYYKDSNLNFSGYVSPKDFFTNKEKLTSSWNGFSNIKTDEHTIKYYLNKRIHDKSGYGWIKISDIPKNLNSIDINKVYIPAANGGVGNDSIILSKPFYGEPGSVCSQTYLVIGYDPEKHNLSKDQCENVIQYISSKFFRYLVSIKKKTQNGPRQVYQLVPVQDFNEKWDDDRLYSKYNLTKEEIDYIELNIRSMS